MRSYGCQTFVGLGTALLLAACSSGGGGNDAPAPATLTVSGRVSFDKVPFATPPAVGLDYGAIIDAPVRGAVVEAINTTDRTTILATTNTDANGNYSMSLQSGVSFFVRAKAQMLRSGTPSWNFRVLNNTNSNALYVMDSADFTNDGSARNLRAASGWGGSGYTGTRTAGPFSILDAVYDAYNLVLSADANAQFPALNVYWSPQNIDTGSNPVIGQIGTTAYRPVATGAFQSGIYVLGMENVDTDEYDQHVIAHEWGHYFQDVFSRDDSVGGSHSLGDRLDMRVAFSEGWGNAFSGMAKNDPRYRDSAGNQQSLNSTVNVEQNGATNPGWFSEASVQSILYDLYDSAADGIDAVALGFAPIYQVMTNELRTASALTSIFPFITALKTRQPTANIDSLVSAQSIRSVDMDLWGSTETNDGGDAGSTPVYRDIFINGGTVTNICSTTANGEYNKLGNRRFLRFNVASAQQVTFRAAAPVNTDPDLVLFAQGLIDSSESDSAATGVEQFNRSLQSGTHVLEVYDFFAVDQTGPAPINTCIDVTLTSP